MPRAYTRQPVKRNRKRAGSSIPLDGAPQTAICLAVPGRPKIIDPVVIFLRASRSLRDALVKRAIAAKREPTEFIRDILQRDCDRDAESKPPSTD